MGMDLITVDKIAALKEENRALRALAEEDAANYSSLQLALGDLEAAYAQSKADHQRILALYAIEVRGKDEIILARCKSIWFWRVVATILFIVVIL